MGASRSQLPSDNEDPEIDPGELLLLNYRTLNKNSFRVALVLGEKMNQTIPEAAQFLRFHSQRTSKYNFVASQGMDLFKIIGVFVQAAQDEDKLREHVRRLIAKHFEIYGQSQRFRFGELLEALEETWLEQASIYCEVKYRDDTAKAWKKLFLDLKANFLELCPLEPPPPPQKQALSKSESNRLLRQWIIPEIIITECA